MRHRPGSPPGCTASPINLLVDHVRAVKPVVRFSDIQLTESAAEFEDLTADPGLSLEERQKSRMLLECVALLPQVQKEVFLLNCETGLPARVVADIVGISHEAGKAVSVTPTRV